MTGDGPVVTAGARRAFGRISLLLPQPHTIVEVSARIGETALYDQVLEEAGPEAAEVLFSDLVESARDEGWTVTGSESGGDLRIALCGAGGHNPRTRLVAISVAGHVALVLKSGELENEVEVQRAAGLFRSLSSVYRPPLDQPEGPAGGRFHLQHGHLELPPGDSEEIGAVILLSGASEVRLSTFTLAEPERANAEEGVKDLASLRGLSEQGVNLEILRAGPRSNRSFSGHEAVYTVEARDDPRTLECRWTFAGRPDSALAPAIDLEMTSAGEQIDDGLRVWDEIVDSVAAPETNSPESTI